MVDIKIPVCEPKLGEKEMEYVSDCIRSGWISSKGKYVNEFEELFSSYVDAKHGVAVSNGTVALHLALASLGIGEGDEVIIPAFTMIASANTVAYSSAKPILVDADPSNWCMNVEKIEDKISDRTKAIMVVHIYGHPVDMDPVLRIAREYDLYVIEDAAEAHGAEYKGRKVGAIGDVGCFSFYANKIITTGEGGMLVTNNEEVAERARRLRNLYFGEKDRFLHEAIGFNYRITNLQAAIGVAQMEKIEEFVDIRRRNAYFYNSLLSEVEGIVLPPEAEWAKNVYWMYSILIEDSFGTNRSEFMRFLESTGIETRPFFHPINVQPPYLKYYKNERYPFAEELSYKGLNLPSGNTLKESDIEYIVEVIKKCKRNM